MPTACTEVLRFLCTYPEVLIAIGNVLIVHGNENPFQHVTEFRQPFQVQSHLEMTRILVQLGHIQRT